jgi:hypothetical protein
MPQDAHKKLDVSLTKPADESTKPPFSDDANLNELLRQYKDYLFGLSASERKAYDRKLKIDWVHSQLTFTGRRPEITREMVEKLYDERRPE